MGQRRLFLAACGAAGVDEAQRYLIMRYAGCPNKHGTDRPSLTCGWNRARHFELAMSVVESLARARGAQCPPPRALGNGRKSKMRSWAEVADDNSHGQRALIAAIAREAVLRVPDVFAADFLNGFIERQTRRDDELHHGLGSRRDLDELDPPQLYRVHEGLKAWVGRAFLARGLSPHSFAIPPAIKRQHAARHGRARA